MWKREQIMYYIKAHTKWLVAVGCICLLCILTVLLEMPVGKIASVMGRSKEMPVCRVDTQEKKIALTFNISKETDIEPLLGLLNQKEVKGTFFVSGQWAEQNPDMMIRINEMGHEYGNLGYQEGSMCGKEIPEMQQDIQRCQNLIYEQTGKKVTLFRPPQGEYDNPLLQTAGAMGMTSVLYDINTYLYQQDTAETVFRKVEERVQNGSIILMGNDMERIGFYLPMIVDHLKREGYEFVFVSELLLEDDSYIDVQGIQRKG